MWPFKWKLLSSTFLWYCVYIAIQSGPNLNVWPFKWKLLSSTFLWYCVYIAIQSGPNLNVWPFKWKLLSSTFLWYCAYLTIQSCSNLNIIVTSHWICNHFVSLKKKKNYSNWSSGGQATLIKSVMAEKRFWSTYFHINIIELYFFALTILL